MASSFTDLLQRQVELSYAPPQNFFFTSALTPQLVFTAQRVDIPVLTAGTIELPNYQNRNNAVPGDTLDYGTLDITFLVDKNWLTYMSLLQWLKGVTNPESFAQNYDWITRNQVVEGVNWQNGTADLFVYGTDPALQPLIEWKFWGAFPSSLEGPSFDATDPETEYLTSRVQFNYLYFEATRYQDGAKLINTMV